MWTRETYLVSFREFEDFITGQSFVRYPFTSTQMSDMGSWLLDKKVHYQKWDADTGSAIFVSEPVIDMAWVKRVKEDLGDDVEIHIKEHDRIIGRD